MKITGINSNNNSTFGRVLTPKEMQLYTSSLNEGLRLLDKKVDIIIHNSSAPSVAKENIGIGTLFSRTVQEKLIPFLKAHGFTGIQQEPNNLRKPGDPSPYAPESSAKNIYMIPLEKLTTEKYGKILPQTFLEKIVKNNRSKESVDYNYVNRVYHEALSFAYKNFNKSGILKAEFENFKKENAENLEKAAIYRVLDKKYQKAWKEWSGLDKRLFAPVSSVDEAIADKRIEEIKKIYNDDIDFFMFQQFLIDMENKESNKLAQKTGVKIIGDSPVASPATDEWANQSLFLEGKAIGCPPDAFSADGQRWGFGYFNPKYIFNPDGTLGKAGKILKAKYDSFFASFPGGLRIDHVIGLVDPFIYNVAEKITPENSGRIYSQGEFKKAADEYSNIMEKIILQSAKEHGMNKNDIICEDLGEPNQPTIDVMKKLDLSGLSVTQFDYRGADAPKRNVIMIGSHDNISFLEYVDQFFSKIKGKDINERSLKTKISDYFSQKFDKNYSKDDELVHFMTKTKHLAEDTAPKNISRKELSEYKQQLRTDKKKFINASFAELFTSPARRVQIFFADFWGLGKTYNRPGTSKGNWELRIPSDFEQEYYKAVSEGKAPNLADAVATALRQRGLDKKNPELIKNLDESARILAE